MNDTSLKLEKCFSEKRQSLIDFYNGTINALDLATKISEFQLSILVYKRLRDELKQEFDDKINEYQSEYRIKDSRCKFLVETEKEKEGYSKSNNVISYYSNRINH